MNHDNHNQESRSNPWAMGVAITGGFLAALLRIVPHPPNFSAVGGLGIFGGARLSGWQAYLLPLAIMVLSDLCLWVVNGFDVKYSLADLNRIPVYTSFMIYVAIGRWFLQNRMSMTSIWLAATIGGVQFFVISNFFDWLVQPYQPYYDSIHEFFRYSRDIDGLTKCFAVALGFYQQETPATAHPLMVLISFPGSMLVWTILGDIVFTTIYLYGYARLAQRSAAPAFTTPEAGTEGAA